MAPCYMLHILPVRLAFRQMLRGVCDGDILLDSNFKICGDAGCLQRLLRTQDPGARFPNSAGLLAGLVTCSFVTRGVW